MENNYEDYEKYECVSFEELKGKTLKKIKGLEKGSERVEFLCNEGTLFYMSYYNDCCASCSVEDICGDTKDLIGSPIITAEEVSSTERQDFQGPIKDEYGDDSFTWTFYKLSTIKGSMTIRWYGSSNGYYSESATFERVKK